MDENEIDAYLGKAVTLTDSAGNKYTGTLEKSVIRVVGYSVKGKKAMPETADPGRNPDNNGEIALQIPEVDLDVIQALKGRPGNARLKQLATVQPDIAKHLEDSCDSLQNSLLQAGLDAHSVEVIRHTWLDAALVPWRALYLTIEGMEMAENKELGRESPSAEV